MLRRRRKSCAQRCAARLAVGSVLYLVAIAAVGAGPENDATPTVDGSKNTRLVSSYASSGNPIGNTTTATAHDFTSGGLIQGRKGGTQGGSQAGAVVQLLSDEPTPENMFTPANGEIHRNSSDKCPPEMVGSCNDCYCCCSTPPFMGLTFTEYVPEACGCATKMHGSLVAVLVVAALAVFASFIGTCWFGRRCCWQPFRGPGSRAQREQFAQGRQEQYHGGGMDQFFA